MAKILVIVPLEPGPGQTNAVRVLAILIRESGLVGAQDDSSAREARTKNLSLDLISVFLNQASFPRLLFKPGRIA